MIEHTRNDDCKCPSCTARRHAVALTDLRLCRRCRKDLDREGVYCIECADWMRHYTRSRKDRFIAAGQCGQCGLPPLHTQTMCRQCAKKATLRSISYRKRKMGQKGG